MYSSAADMIERYGAVEMARLTAGEGASAELPDLGKINRALLDASALIESHIRRRYRTPILAVPVEIAVAAATLARYDLANRESRSPSDAVRADRDATMAWLRGIRDGTVLLDLDTVPSSEESHATVTTREPVYGRHGGNVYGGLG